MENTLENKAKFFALYWGQKVVHYNNNLGGLRNISQEHFNDDSYLELTPSYQITDEDAKRVCEIFDVSYNNNPNDESHFDLEGALEWIEAFYEEPAGYYVDGYAGNQLLSASDYLRSKGYALPYMGLSVEKQIEYGWVKLKN